MKKRIILGFCIVLLLFCTVGTATAKTWYVDNTGGADFMGIQDAIDNASAGDTIIVKEGWTGRHESIELNKQLTLKGVNKPIEQTISIRADGCVVDGFEIWNYECERCAGISISSSENIIKDNIISSGSRGDPVGIRIISQASRNTIANNLIKFNFATGLEVKGSSNIIVNNTIVYNNLGGYVNDWMGGVFVPGKNNLFYLNTIANNKHYNVHATAPNFWNSTEKLSYKFNGQNYTDYLGNYWGHVKIEDYNPTGFVRYDYFAMHQGNYWSCTDDTNGDGIIDKHRQIDENNIDYKPLMANITVKLSKLPSPYEIPILEEIPTETPTTETPPEDKITPKVPTEKKTTPEVPEGEERGIPVFEGVFAVAGVLMAAYVFRRRNK